MLKKYSKTFNFDKTLLPSVFSFIKALPEEYLYYNKYEKIKHPGAILTRAIDEITTSFLKVLNLHDTLAVIDFKNDKKSTNEKGIREMLDAQQELIMHFDSLIDECYLVLKGLCPPPTIDTAIGEKFVSEWIRKNDYTCAGNFLGRIKNIQKFIDMFSNGLKHGNQRLDLVVVNVSGYQMLGFYIDVLKGVDVRNTYQWLSPKMDKFTIAFSFNYILKALLLCLYEICDDLEETIKVHIKEMHGKKLFGKITMIKQNDTHEDMINRIAQLENVFYPYEHKKFPKISVLGRLAKISYPHGDKIPYTGQLTATSISRADGYTKEFPLPAFG